MSHKSDVKTTLNNKEYIIKALNNLGYKTQVAEEKQKLSTRGHYSDTKSDVDILITELPNGTTTNNEIGLAEQADGTFVATGDYYFTRGLTSKALSSVLTVEAKKEEVNDKLMNLGFTMCPEVNESTQEVTYTFERYM